MSDDGGVTEENIGAFRAAYAACTGDVFVFEGREVLKRYAYYVIEFWDDPEMSAVCAYPATFASRMPPIDKEPN